MTFCCLLRRTHVDDFGLLFGRKLLKFGDGQYLNGIFFYRLGERRCTENKQGKQESEGVFHGEFWFLTKQLPN